MSLITAAEAKQIALNFSKTKETENKKIVTNAISKEALKGEYQVDVFQVEISNDFNSELTNKGYKIEPMYNQQDGNYTRISW